ncbi:HAUS augmin-like complex subunit 2 isoform X2 [Nothobranchius furzeri]|uniref:HAUS augmin-like complex, subunit 2 n=1 Tax=Nothobranchius furzeri TaxID=105023 RepID=A0A1A8U9B6_NOTFU|nr:HAUS augmin-like complex subunit 2 isoform X2 [Nothobranchius furzeri]KAF7201122.1 transcript variant X3 [Nothobranchius furzeri]
MWEPSLFSVTPAASLLSRCVSVGAVSQDEIDAAFSSPNPVFSTRLQETEEMIRNQKQLDELQLELELLKMEERSADVSHDFHLDQKNKRLQLFACHLLDLLREQRTLRQRLMRPLARTNLPVPAHMQSFMVRSVELMMDFVACLEEKLRSAQIQTTTADSLTLLETSHSLMLTLAADVEAAFMQILQKRKSSSQQEASEAHQRSLYTTCCDVTKLHKY